MAEQVPACFRFTFKVTEASTIKHFPRLPKFGKKGATDNRDSLNMDRFNRLFLRPCERIAEKAGILIFEFPPFEAYDLKQSGHLM